MTLKIERKRKWRLSPKAAYSIQKTNAKARGISWEISFKDWWDIWQQSGKWEQRGTKPEQYCMCRHNDEGPYHVNNVRIDTFSNNAKENFSILERDFHGRVLSKQ